MPNLYPYKLKPVLKDIIWGGYNLSAKFGKGAAGQKIAESWELSGVSGSESVIANGIHEGKKLTELTGDLPVLIKFIDAAQDLSVQVHPDDGYASRYPGESGKTEMWYVVDALPDSRLVCGFNKRTDRERIARALDGGSVMEHMRTVEVKKGDVFFIPCGLVHAIGKGITIAEIQQSSDTTYRLYDYDRVYEGEKRELHIEKALDVCVYEPFGEGKVEYDKDAPTVNLVKCEYFSVDRLNVKGKHNDVCDQSSFHSLLCVEGGGVLEHGGITYRINQGDCWYLGAGLGEYALSGNITALKTYIL